MRAVLYIRRSHADAKRGISIELQRKECMIALEREGWTLVREPYIDDNESAFEGTPTRRPAFRQLQVDAQQRPRPFDVVLVYKYDRFARRTYIYFPVIQEFESRGIVVRSATESPDWLAMAVSGVIAEQYSRALSARMHDVRKHEAMAGRHVGPVPVGFRRENGILIPTEAIIGPQLAFQLRARRMSYEAICDALRDAKHRMPDGRPFTKYQVEAMLKNPVYIGRVRCTGEEYAGAHEAVIDLALWEQVQSLSSTIGPRARAASPALLSGLARCANCGATMWLNGKNSTYYACSGQLTHAREPRCNMRSVLAAQVEAQLLASVAVLLSDRALLDAAAAEIRTLAAVPVPVAIDRAKLEARLDRYKRAWLGGDIEEAEYRAEQQRIQIELLRFAPAPDRPDPSQAIALLADIPALLAQATTSERRAVLTELFDAIYIKPHLALAARPTRLYQELLKAADKRLIEWAGWASSPIVRPFLTDPLPLYLPRCRIAA